MKRPIAILALAVLAAPALAQNVEEGSRLYFQHCATCHGTEGRGNGPMAAVLTLQPTDLTALAAGGEFPFERVIKRIDGRDPLASHGSPMPVYGPFFEQGPEESMKTPSGQPVLTSKPVVDLVGYLLSIQD
ncbi:c-type cytochrome [Lutimaribacter marinistellae]|uniref:C-type cytochrome n=1 Tax=Lutimaribacter marinistellae TaxID=1820329 RepID=A0ABV7TKA3_9RHOB